MESKIVFMQVSFPKSADNKLKVIFKFSNLKFFQSTISITALEGFLPKIIAKHLRKQKQTHISPVLCMIKIWNILQRFDYKEQY